MATTDASRSLGLNGRVLIGRSRDYPHGPPTSVTSALREGNMDSGLGAVGPWTLNNKLGAGGMGTVYLGTDGSRLAAVKVISPALAEDPTFRSRFRREIEICRRVSGGQVAELLDAGPDDPQPWLAVRYVPGPTLREAVVQHGPLAGETLRGFAIATAEALRQVHRAGVVHRDLKPSNVILTPDTPVIIDFGIAAAGEATALTATGMIIGSAGWMAPEQILGHQAGPPADVFSWGGLVAYAATGRPPFGEGRPEALSYRIVHGEPDLDGLDSTLREIVGQAMDPDPQQRPSLDAILRSLAGTADETLVAEGIAMTWLLDGSEELTRAQTVAAPQIPMAIGRDRPARRWAIPVAIAAVLATFVGGTAYFVSQQDGADAEVESAANLESSPLQEEGTQVPPGTGPTTPTDETSPTSTTTATTLPTTTPAPARVPVSDLDFANRSYEIFCEDASQVTPIELVDGQWTSPMGPTYGVVDGFDVAYGDVTGDGQDEALVLITCAAGAGSNAWTNTVVIESTEGGVTQVGQPIPSRTELLGGELIGQEPYYEDDDPMCCPSSMLVSTWVLRNGGWSQEQSKVVPYDQASN